MNNPYAKALDGLVLADPVKAFFDWCKERERIRIKRESAAPAPWSEDPIFQKGRFLNTFREDDRGSRAVIRFCNPVKDVVPELIHALFFARWCNQHTTLDALKPGILKQSEALADLLKKKVAQPWCSEVYPVVPVLWEGKSYPRLEVCTVLFPGIIPFLENCILSSDGNVVAATNKINEVFQMSNDFPIFMAVMDISWFRPELIRPDSPVPTGIGAVPFLDRLQKCLGLAEHHTTARKMMDLQADYWPEARRPLMPIDIEYLSCECRKYYSYVNGTKRFEGKNLFIPYASTKQ